MHDIDVVECETMFGSDKISRAASTLDTKKRVKPQRKKNLIFKKKKLKLPDFNYSGLKYINSN